MNGTSARDKVDGKKASMTGIQCNGAIRDVGSGKTLLGLSL